MIQARLLLSSECNSKNDLQYIRGSKKDIRTEKKAGNTSLAEKTKTGTQICSFRTVHMYVFPFLDDKHKSDSQTLSTDQKAVRFDSSLDFKDFAYYLTSCSRPVC